MSDPYSTRVRDIPHLFLRQDPVIWSKYSPDNEFSDHMFQYLQEGYCVIRSLLEPTILHSLCKKVCRLSTFITDQMLINYEPNDSNRIRSVLGVHNDPEILRLAIGFASISESILCGKTYLHQSRVNYKMGRQATGWSWHSDFETWHSQDGMPSMRCFSVIVPLENNDTGNGPFTIIPKSHLLYWSAPKSDRTYSAQENFSDQKEGVPPDATIEQICSMTKREPTPIICSVGDVILFDCNLLHKSDPISEENRTRTNLYFVINSTKNQLQQPYTYDFCRPEQMGHRKEIVGIKV